MKASQSKEFCDFLLRRVSEYDQRVIKDIRYEDAWVGEVTWGVRQPDWWECREAVRKLSEGVHFQASELPEQENIWDRFSKVCPDIGGWKPYQSHDWVPASAGCVGEPCDPT